jgi:hypothetical protein
MVNVAVLEPGGNNTSTTKCDKISPVSYILKEKYVNFS